MYRVPRRQQRQQKPLADVLLWGALVQASPAVVLNTDGSFMATLAYRGHDLQMLGADEATAYLHQLHGVLMRLGTGWSLLADSWTESTSAYLESTWTHPTPAFVDAARRAQVAEAQYQETDYYLTVCWKPQDVRDAKWYGSFFERGGSATALASTDARHLDLFTHSLHTFCDALARILPAATLCDGPALCTYLHRCISWERYPVAVPEIPLYFGRQLADTGFLHAYTPMLGEQYLRPITIASWPRHLGMAVPRALATLPFPYRFAVKWLALDAPDARALIDGTIDRWDTTITTLSQLITAMWKDEQDNQTLQHIAGLKRARHSLDLDECAFGYIAPTVLVWAHTREELTLREREVVKRLQAYGFVAAVEKVNASAAWAASLPGDGYVDTRSVPVPSLALAFLLPHCAVWSGPSRDTQYDDVPLFLASSDGVPFRFTLHPEGSELGNTMVLGPSRSGKSALLGLMMSQFWRYKQAQVCCFDKDYALYAATILGGGTHYDLGGDVTLGLQPLGQVDASDRERRFAHHWVCELIRSQTVDLTPDDREQLWLALGHLAAFPQTMRTLSTYVELVQVQRLKSAFAPFLAEGPYGFLDADHDDIAFHDWTTFEMRRLLELPEVLPHVLRYLFHRMGDRFDGRPTLVILDESRKLLADPVFGPEILDLLKERAKVNVSAVLCTQEIADFSTSAAVQAIFASVATWLYLPNRSATNPPVAAFYQDCGLSEEHIRLLALSTPKQDYLYKSEAGARRFQLVLSPLERLLVAASTPDEIRALRHLAASEPHEPLVAAWLRHNGFAAEADIYLSHYHPTEVADDHENPTALAHLYAGAERLYAAAALTNGQAVQRRASPDRHPSALYPWQNDEPVG
jgi:type IV secretion/conjugal transfer VirB4 family ATPase